MEEAPEESGHPPTTLPQYPEMIMAAIEALNEKEGSDKSSITNFIESSCADLPPTHSTLLSYHLNDMKERGEIIMLKNSYLKPTHLPLKRGRGRPPKANKKSVLKMTYVGPPRGRGRPPKVRDPSSPPPPSKTIKVSSGKPRGRPPKIAKVGTPAADVSAAKAGKPKGRGRPPKVKVATVAAVGA